MIAPEVNLAAKPFRDRRPLVRTIVLLWAVAAVLLVANAWFYARLYTGTSQARRQQAEMRERAGEERRRIESLTKALAGYDLDVHNELSTFVNRQIDARVFSWSDLFDDLAETLPADVRLVSLAPKFWGGERRRLGREVNRGEVPLEIRAVARDGTVLLELLDRMFAHAKFREPNLNREAVAEDGLYDFDMRVIYAPASDEPEPTAVAAGGAESERAREVDAGGEAAETMVDGTEGAATAAPKQPRRKAGAGKSGKRPRKPRQPAGEDGG